MSINFPDVPALNQIHADAGVAWRWDGTKWTAYTGPLPGDVTRVTAGTGLTGGGTADAFGNITLGLEIPVTVGHGGTSATSAGSALFNLGGFPTAGGTITGSVSILGGLNVVSNITSSGSITGSSVAAGTYVSAPVLQGNSDGNAGALRTWNTSDRLTFQYDNSSSGGQLQWRINGLVCRFISSTENFFNTVLAPGGGPTSTALYGFDIPGNSYSFYADTASSDERIKDRIAPTRIDALASIQKLEVSEFDVKGPVAAWFANVDRPLETRLAAMQDAAPVHVPIGFVAQRIENQIPEAVTVVPQHGGPAESPIPPDGKSVIVQAMIPYIVRAIQQLAERLEEPRRS